MSKHHLGEFEEIVMLTVAILGEEAYGVTIIDEIESRLNRNVSMGSLQTVLRRLEKKGYVSSEFGEPTQMRGGKRKRFFRLSMYGKQLLTEARDQRNSLWDALPEVIITSN